MIEGVSLRNPLFVNTIGHGVGALLFGLVLILIVRIWRRSQDRERLLSAIAALLAFLWNLGSILGLSSAQSDGDVAGWLVAVNFSILSILPAVLLHLVLRGQHRLYIWFGYLISAVAIGFHFAELALPSSKLHQAAVLVITLAFSGLILAAGFTVLIRGKQRSSAANIACLLLFTISFIHFGYGHSTAAWANEIAWHHAGVPLILIVILRDFRFLLLEAFTRFAANFGLAVLYAFGVYEANGRWHLLDRARSNLVLTGLLILLFCLSLIFFAYARALVQKALTQGVFRRGDFNLYSQRILRLAVDAASEEELLRKAALELYAFADATQVAVAPPESFQQQALSLRYPWAEVQLPLRFSRGDSTFLLLGTRRGSRRYLPEDLDALNELCAIVIQQVERLRSNEVQRLVHQAELRALQSQINPHFLFNALNTLYGTISRESSQARRLVLNLAEIFRYVLKTETTLIPLGEELRIVEAYLEIEALRLGDRLHTEVSVGASARGVMIPILSVQPLVENAVKHGVSQLGTRGTVRVTATESDTGLWISVQDTGPGFSSTNAYSGTGTGLDNVRQRLRLCYGRDSDLQVQSSSSGASVSFFIPLVSNALPSPSADVRSSA